MKKWSCLYHSIFHLGLHHTNILLFEFEDQSQIFLHLNLVGVHIQEYTLELLLTPSANFHDGPKHNKIFLLNLHPEEGNLFSKFCKVLFFHIHHLGNNFHFQGFDQMCKQEHYN